MKNARVLPVCVAGILLGTGPLFAQQKAHPPDVPVKLTVVFSEYEGSKKISSLPYTLAFSVGDRAQGGMLRLGLRVPVKQGKETGGEQQHSLAEVTEYQDVGTSVDCHATAQDDGSFLVSLTAERNSVFEPGAQDKPIAWHPGNSAPTEQPIFSAFRMRSQWVMRDNTTVETIEAADPITARVTKVAVTLNVVK